MNEELMLVVISICGSIWTIFKTTERYRRLKGSKHLRALECLSAGVLAAFDEYRHTGGDIKILTAEDKVILMKSAKKAAIEIGNKNSISIVSSVGGNAFVNLHLSQQVERFQRGGTL